MTAAVILGLASLAAFVVAVVATIRHRRLARAIDDATARLSGGAARGASRVERLGASIDHFERLSAESTRAWSRLEGTIQVAPLGIVITDDDGDVLVANPAAERYLGTRLGEAVAHARIRRAIEDAIATRSASATEISLYTPVPAVLEVSAIPIEFGTERVGAAAFIADVTEARRVDAMRRDFVANVSHELKTPLAALAALAETLSESFDDDSAATTLAKRLRIESERLARLVGDILDLSQAEAPTTSHDAVPIPTLVRAIRSEASLLAEQRGVALDMSDVSSEAVVAGDGVQLRSMLFNLVENAIKYSYPDPGSEPPPVTVRSWIEGDKVILEVTDQGIGIADAHLNRIFERFYRVDRARSGENGGTGLGLAIARHVARRHGGDIAVESVAGAGSTFTITLPAAVAA